MVGILGLGVSGPMLGSYSTGQSSPLPLDIETPPVNTVVADIPIWGGASGGSVLDAASGAIYQPSNYTNVTVIDGATDSSRAVDLLGIFSSPETPTYVGGSVNQIFVPQISSNSKAPDNVSVISGTTNDIVANLSTRTRVLTGRRGLRSGERLPIRSRLGQGQRHRARRSERHRGHDHPGGYSPSPRPTTPPTGTSTCPTLLAGTESIISTKTDTVVATISGLSLLPVFYGDEELSLDGPVYDPISQEVYQPDSGANNLTVLNGCRPYVKNITVGSGPAAPGIDPVNGNLYVPDGDRSVQRRDHRERRLEHGPLHHRRRKRPRPAHLRPRERRDVCSEHGIRELHWVGQCHQRLHGIGGRDQPKSGENPLTPTFRPGK